MPGLTPERLAARKLGIGGSEAAAAIGVHPSVTPFDLYRHKVLNDPWPVSTSDFNLWLGHMMEPVAAAAFTRETGIELEEDDQHFKHPEHEFMLGSIDRKVVGKREGVELKAWSEHSKPMWGETGTDDVPIGVLCQAIHYLIVTGFDVWHVGALLGTEFRHYTIVPTQNLIDMVIEKEAEMWRYVTDRVPPPPINLEDLKKLYKRAKPGHFMTATADGVELHKQIYDAKQLLKTAKEDVEALEFKVKETMKTAGTMIHPDNPTKKLFSWNDHSKRVANTKAMKTDGIYDVYSTEIWVRPLLVKAP